MRSPAAHALLVLATALLAGCVIEPPVAHSADVPAAQQPEPSTRAEPVPGPAPESTPRETTTPERDPPRTGPGPFTTVPIFVKGRTPLRECAVTRYIDCQEVTPAEDTVIPLDALARPTFLTGTLTWKAETPATHRMYVYLVSDEHGGRPTTWQSEGRKLAGTSPLTVSFDLSEYRGETGFALVVDNMEYCFFPDGPALNCAFYGSAGYTLPQDFVFRGSLSGWN